ncbi:hypothetical protein DL764_003609 [Monosporascus ibericus]|uniref:Rhodopsin domain-containing protein n=1 Tax=Monosporascus ibericus TaxID=155417 RepID=A0A4Q4TJ81_9PEZI|nr:hypothetical protein DL764_003609 [Monosporascus ibericus]
MAFSITGSIVTQYGAGRHIWDVPFSDFNINFMKFNAIAGTFYGISIMLTKLSVLIFFLRFVPWGNLRRVIYVLMAIVVLYSLTASFEWTFACQPLEKYWDFTVTGGSCINYFKVFIFSGVMNSATDAVILMLPVQILRDLRLPKRQKIGVILILMTGGFVLVVSIIRLKMTADMNHTSDFTWDSTPSAIWWTIEVHVAIVCACLPSGKPFLRKHLPKVIGSTFGASAGTKRRTPGSSQPRRLPSRDTPEDPEDIMMEDHLTGRGPANVSTTTVELGTAQPVSAEYSSDKGLIIPGNQDVGKSGP